MIACTISLSRNVHRQSATARTHEPQNIVRWRKKCSGNPLAAHPWGRRIRSNGPITFAEFMRECLYHPQYGYYSRLGNQRFADYYTSGDVHPIFGRLLTRQLKSKCGKSLGSPRPVYGRGSRRGPGLAILARHILDFAALGVPEFYAALEYGIAVERSPGRRARACRAARRCIMRGPAKF